MSRLTDRVERDLREIAAGAHPSPSAWDSIAARLGDDAGSEVALAPAPSADRSRRAVWLAVAAAFLVVAGSIAVLTRVGDDRSTSTADPDLTTFVSPRNGFSVESPDRGEVTVTPAKQLWGFSEQVDDGFDVVETGSAAVFKGASTVHLYGIPSDDGNIDDYLSDDGNIDDYLSDDFVLPDGCGVPRSRQAEITIDGESGRISECPNRIEATVVAGGRLYLFTLTHDRSDVRAVFDAFVATIRLTPETAVDFPGLTTTFVSPTNGFSFDYHDRGGLAPATDLWDPGNEQLDDNDNQADDGFDAVETGLGAYFLAASTEIPEGVSIDEWVDDYVSPSGCGRPRSQQEEITIDGQSGRIFECPTDQIVATVEDGGRLYLFTLLTARPDARAFFDAWVATIDLTPETATVP